MSAFELRPLSLGELLDRAFLLYRRNFWLFAGIMIVPACVMLPLQIIYLRGQAGPFPWSQPSPQIKLVAYSYVVILLDWLLYAVIQAATTYAVSEAYLGRHTTIREAFGHVRGRYWRVIGVSFGVGLRALGWVLLFVLPAVTIAVVLVATMARSGPVPGNKSLVFVPLIVVLAASLAAVWICVRYAVSIQAALLENINGRAAIRRSVELSRGRRWQAFIAILLGIVVTYTLATLTQGPFYAAIALLKMKGRPPIQFTIAMATFGTIGGVIAGPLLMIILVLFYYDLRIRKEAFDLQQMMGSLPEPKPAAATPAV